MARALGHTPKGFSEIQKQQRQMAICDNALVQQAARYRTTEQKLLAAYRRYIATHETEMLCPINKLENEMISVYEDVIAQLIERETLRSKTEALRDSYHSKAMDICDSFVNDEATERLDQAWVKKTRDQLLRQMQEKVEFECRARAWDLDCVQRQLEQAASAAFARLDADAEAKKKYVSQYSINLIGYAVRVGKYPEELIKEMHEQQQSENDLNAKLAANFCGMEKQRLESERTMYECAMAGQNICKWVDEHIRRCGDWCQEREKLYYEIREKRKRVASLQATAETGMNATYEGRAAFMSNQIKNLQDVVLRAKRERELLHTRTISLLKILVMVKRLNKN